MGFLHLCFLKNSVKIFIFVVIISYFNIFDIIYLQIRCFIIIFALATNKSIKMLILNEDLFKNLAGALRMTYKEISTQSGISITTLYRIIETPLKISVQQLIDLANGLSVPVSRFFSQDSKDAVGEREDYIKLYDFRFCFYDKNAVQKVMESDTVSSYRDIASIVGLHPNRVKESLLAEHRLPVTRLLNFCDSLKIDFFSIVVDPNSISANAKERKNLDTVSEYATIMNHIATIQREMASFKVLLEDTKRDIDELNKKLDAVTDANDVQAIAWRTRRIVSELAKESQKQQKQTNKLIVNDK